jgi:hypothetical protein
MESTEEMGNKIDITFSERISTPNKPIGILNFFTSKPATDVKGSRKFNINQDTIDGLYRYFKTSSDAGNGKNVNLYLDGEKLENTTKTLAEAHIKNGTNIEYEIVQSGGKTKKIKKRVRKSRKRKSKRRKL